MEFDGTEYNKKHFEDGKPCSHPGCLSHVTHPCELCGRIGGKAMTEPILSRSQERRISVQKGTVSPERLADILDKIMTETVPPGLYEMCSILADELLKVVDIREKE